MGVFHVFLNFTNGTKLRKTSHIGFKWIVLSDYTELLKIQWLACFLKIGTKDKNEVFH